MVLGCSWRLVTDFCKVWLIHRLVLIPNMKATFALAHHVLLAIILSVRNNNVINVLPFLCCQQKFNEPSPF